MLRRTIITMRIEVETMEVTTVETTYTPTTLQDSTTRWTGKGFVRQTKIQVNWQLRIGRPRQSKFERESRGVNREIFRSISEALVSHKVPQTRNRWNRLGKVGGRVCCFMVPWWSIPQQKSRQENENQVSKGTKGTISAILQRCARTDRIEQRANEAY